MENFYAMTSAYELGCFSREVPWLIDALSTKTPVKLILITQQWDSPQLQSNWSRRLSKVQQNNLFSRTFDNLLSCQGHWLIQLTSLKVVSCIKQRHYGWQPTIDCNMSCQMFSSSQPWQYLPFSILSLVLQQGVFQMIGKARNCAMIRNKCLHVFERSNILKAFQHVQIADKLMKRITQKLNRIDSV